MATKKITKEEYEKLKDVSYSELDKFIRSRLSEAEYCGYGYYGGGRLLENNGEYFVKYDLGSSCD